MTMVHARLDEFETEALAGILHEEIVGHRDESKVEHACGRITDAELRWHLAHAEFLQGVISKLFPSSRRRPRRARIRCACGNVQTTGSAGPDFTIDRCGSCNPVGYQLHSV